MPSSNRSATWMVRCCLYKIEGRDEDLVITEHRSRKACAAEMSTSSTAGDVRRQPIAELADRTVPARTRQPDVGRAQHVWMRVGDRHAASDDPQAVGIVDVVTDVDNI